MYHVSYYLIGFSVSRLSLLLHFRKVRRQSVDALSNLAFIPVPGRTKSYQMLKVF